MLTIRFFLCCSLWCLHTKLNGQNVEIESAEKFLGIYLFTELKKIEKSMMLDHSVFGFFNCCQVITEVLSEYGFF